MNNDLLFSLQENEYVSGKLFFKMLDHISISNTPCLLRKKSWDEGRPEIEVLFTFPRIKGAHINEISVFRRENVMLVNKPAFVYRNRFKSIDRFDFERLPALQSYVEVNDTITFQFWRRYDTAYGHNAAGTAELTGDAVIEFLNSMSDQIDRMYKYTSCEYWHLDKDYREKVPGNLSYYLTFISLFNCIPIFNRKKMDGMVMMLNIVNDSATEAKGYMRAAGQVAVLMTNNLENKFVIDGVHIANPTPLSKQGIDSLMKFVTTNSRFKAKDKKTSEGEGTKKPAYNTAHYYVSADTWFSTSASTTTYG